jgi:electron transport complex protein RnfG
MKETLRLILTLLVICVLAGVMLAWANDLTKAPIAEAARVEKMTALNAVLPDYDNQPDIDIFTNRVDETDWIFYVARKDGAFTGAAFETTSSEGYGGDIIVMVGVQADGTVRGIEILKAMETPGLGAKIKDDAFKSYFAAKSITETRWSVKKDQGDIDQITAATISSRAVVSAVSKGLDVYMQNRDAITQTGETEGEPASRGQEQDNEIL